MSTSKSYTTALSIAGFDGSGGAGMQADLKTFSALGCYGMSVLTSLPVQNTQGVQHIYDIPLKCIKEQLESIFEDIPPQVVKIGMLHTVDIIETVARALEKYKPQYVVLDPVMVAKSGHRLLRPDAIEALKALLFPLATVITPNLPEAEDLLRREIASAEEMQAAASDLGKLGPRAVIVKGGHGDDDTSRDCLFLNNEHHWLESIRIQTLNTHGTGCTFSAAIASELAKGRGVVDSVKAAKGFISGAIESGSAYKIGHGHGPVNHFYDVWNC